jgi:hypothetical protein
MALAPALKAFVALTVNVQPPRSKASYVLPLVIPPSVTFVDEIV